MVAYLVMALASRRGLKRSRPGEGRWRTGAAGSPGDGCRPGEAPAAARLGSCGNRRPSCSPRSRGPVATIKVAGGVPGAVAADEVSTGWPGTSPTPATPRWCPRAGKDGSPGAFPKAQVVTVSECASHAAVLAAIGPYALKAGGERALARRLYPRLEEDWLLIADRGFYDWQDWCTAADTGAALLWRFKSDIRLPVLEILPDGSYRSVLVTPKAKAAARQELVEAARAGEKLDPARARHVRVVEYEVTDRDGEDELIALVTTITGPLEAPAAALAAAYHQRWEHETANSQLKTILRGPGRILRSASPDMIKQEIWGYLLTHHAISALVCTAATSAGIDPDRVKFKRTVRAVRRRVADPAFPQQQAHPGPGRRRHHRPSGT